MPEPITLTITYPMPIPVGHRVEIRVFSIETGVFSRSLEAIPNQPLVKDLDTGVVYGAGWHFEDITMYRSGAARPLPLEPRADLKEQYAPLVGRVAACRIAWIGGGDSAYPQTTLVVEPALPGEGYR